MAQPVVSQSLQKWMEGLQSCIESGSKENLVRYKQLIESFPGNDDPRALEIYGALREVVKLGTPYNAKLDNMVKNFFNS